MALVRDILEPDVLCLSPDTPLEEAARALSERQVGAAPVCSREGRVVGIVSKTDVTEFFGPAGEARSVRDAMTPDVLSIPSGSPIEGAIHLMAFEGVHRLVVLDDEQRLAGIVSAMDVLRHLAGFARREQRVVAVAPPEAPAKAEAPGLRLSCILVPTDFSACSARALDAAIGLAGPFGATVVLMHSCDREFLGTATFDRLHELASKTLDETLATTRLRWPRTEAVLHTGDPRDEVLRAIDEKKADLVVMGTHGRRGWQRALLGSVAETIVRTAAVPVMTVPGA